MRNPLVVFWRQMFGRTEMGRRMRRAPLASALHASIAIFLIMRRMRAPLITIITIFSISVIGFTFIPGMDSAGQPHQLSFFDAFYVMSYTATTIGFGELPYPFTAAQRLWVTGAIYLSVVGWAYAIGSLLALLQDKGFRQAIALQRFQRKLARIREPFLLFAGFGRTGELLAESLDRLGETMVVVDADSQRVDQLDMLPLHADIPGLVGDVRDPHNLAIAGLDHPYCAGVLALTNDDEANLAVVLTAYLLRPELPVYARTHSGAVAHRMTAFGNPSIVNPFDRFGDHLRLALRQPASYQLLTWLEAGLGAPLPPRGHPPADGRWVVCGYGRFGKELTKDLRAEGLEVQVIDSAVATEAGDLAHVTADASAPAALAAARLADAVGIVAGTDNDFVNLALAEIARGLHPGIFVAARQNRQSSAPLFSVLNPDALLVPTEVVAHEVYAQLSTPLLWRFIQEMPALGDAWAADLIDRMTRVLDDRLYTWKHIFTVDSAPALRRSLSDGTLTVGDLMRDPEDRDQQLPVVVLMLQHPDGTALLGPGPGEPIRMGDQIMIAGQPSARRDLETTLIDESVMEYVLNNRHVPSSWVWRQLKGRRAESGVMSR